MVVVQTVTIKTSPVRDGMEMEKENGIKQVNHLLDHAMPVLRTSGRFLCILLQPCRADGATEK
jgi:hypothetical protein